MMTSFPASSTPAPSQPRTIGSRSAGSPTPRRDHTSWWFSPAARSLTTDHPGRATGLNHHDVWSLLGVGLPADRLPMVLGCDGAGVDEAGNEVIIHAVVPSDGWTGDETLDPARTLLSELYDGTLAEYVAVPTNNLVPKPAGLSFEHAACLSTAWLTAYRMLFVNAGLTPGATVLVQGAGGGVSTALTQ